MVTHAVKFHQTRDGEYGYGRLELDEYQCEYLVTDVIQLSQDQTNPFAQTILKIYDDMEVLSRTEKKLLCGGFAKGSRGDSPVEFYIEEDRDGDRFIYVEFVEELSRATPTPGPAPASSAPPQGTKPGSLTAQAIISEFQSNAIRATAKYSGQTATVVGNVESIDYSYLPDTFAKAPLVTIGPFGSVRCFITDISEAANLATGLKVTVMGTFADWDGDWLMLHPCTIGP
jgi:hypothetical protein